LKVSINAKECKLELFNKVIDVKDDYCGKCDEISGECGKCGGIIRRIKKRGSGYIRITEICQRCGKVFLNKIEKQYG